MERTARILDLLKASPGDSFLQHALALEYIKTGNDAGARQLFEELLARDPAYTGSYYHLAKLLERTNEKEQAMAWYEKGMAAARAAGDGHSFNELRAAYDDLAD